MPEVSRKLVLTASILGLANGCASCEGGVESFVDVPASTEELELWAEERGLEAEIGKLEKKSTGNVACGHSPACVLLVPILIADAVMPPTLKRGSVVDDEGKVLYAGVFDLRGRLMTARVAEGEEFRVIERLDLGELGLRPIVEVARVKVDEEGNEVSRTRTKLVPQVDLVTRYADELADEDDADDRAQLVLEELRVLGAGEGLEPVLARYRDLEEIDDEELADVMASACGGHSIGGPELLPIVVESGGVESAVAAVPCVGKDMSSAKALVPRVVEAACSNGTGAAANALGGLSRSVRDDVLEGIDACEPKARRTYLQLAVGERPPHAELVAAFADRESGRLLARRLEPRKAEDRKVLVEVLDGKSGPTKLIAERLLRNTTSGPTPEEATKVARVYAGEIRTGGDDEARFFLLGWLARSEGSARSAAVEALRGAEYSPRVAGALVLLANERSRAGDALKGVEADEMRAYAWDDGNFGMNESTLIGWALHESGCSEEEIRVLARALDRGKTTSPSCARWSR